MPFTSETQMSPHRGGLLDDQSIWKSSGMDNRQEVAPTSCHLATFMVPEKGKMKML
jgi:hypothetical protein